MYTNLINNNAVIKIKVLATSDWVVDGANDYSNKHVAFAKDVKTALDGTTERRYGTVVAYESKRGLIEFGHHRAARTADKAITRVLA